MNWSMRRFGAALREATAARVKVVVLYCAVKSDQLEINGEIPIKL